MKIYTVQYTGYEGEHRYAVFESKRDATRFQKIIEKEILSDRYRDSDLIQYHLPTIEEQSIPVTRKGILKAINYGMRCTNDSDHGVFGKGKDYTNYY